MVQLRSTTGCVNTPRILFALEEMGVPYRTEIVPDGTFTARYGIPGPELVDGERTIVEVGAILRHVVRTYGTGSLWPSDRFDQAEVDRWLDFQAVRLARAAAARDLETLGTLLGALERHLRTRTWMLGDDFTVADCGFVPAMMKRDKFPLDKFPAIAAYFDRLGARPAWKRALAATP
ncbi:MAG: glutathione S-transferase family protein [Kofleriaceae bacterium]|nr:MAG: glutathione S-transferase family protein [Kofleriaceae bacterium]MBZ0231249.1 glutathione S-transferase family protein [Kofleriaceae bacterium]